MNSNSSVDNVYLSLSMQNNTSDLKGPATFSATYQEDIISKPSDYYMSVVKFEIPLQTLPLMVLPLYSPIQNRQYSTYAIGTVSTVITGSGSDIIGVGTAFTSDMVGSTIVLASGNNFSVTEYVSPTLLRTNVAQVNPNQAYTLYNGDLASTNTVTQVGTTVTLNSLFQTRGFTQNMVGGSLIYPTGQVVTVLSVQNSITMTVSAPVAIGPTSYKIYFNANPNISQTIVGVCPNNQPGSAAGVAPYTPIPGFSRNLEFVPQSQFIKVGDIDYAYVYTYNQLIQMMNQALFDSWVAAGSPGGVDNQPYFHFNPSTSLINIVLPQEFVEAGANGWTVLWNDEINAMIPSFQSYLSKDPAFFAGRYELNTNQLSYDSNYILTPESAPAAGDAIYMMPQDYNTIDYINSIRKIVLTTRTIPIRKEYFPPENSINSGLSNTIPIMSDFQINLDNVTGAQRSVAIYEANPYRLIDLISDSPMRRIDVELYWSDQENRLYPIFINNHDSATIKLGFFSKKLYNSDNMILGKL